MFLCYLCSMKNNKVVLEVHPLKDYQVLELTSDKVYQEAFLALFKDMAMRLGKNYTFKHEDEDFTLDVAWHEFQ